MRDSKHSAPEPSAPRPSLLGRLKARIVPELPDFYRLLTDQCELTSRGTERLVAFLRTGDPDAADEAGGGANAVGRFNPRSRVKPGDTAEIAVANENLHFFDYDTREAIWD